MKSGMFGALVGLIVGLVIGTALFGPLGGMVGLVFGPIAGFFIMTPMAVSSASEAAKTPFVVECPETHKAVEVTVDTKQAGRAELWNQPQRIATCARFGGPPNCDEGCVEQLGI